jgi:hypothetical protein
MKKSIFAIILISAIAFACKKEDNNPKITITIQAPVEGFTCMSGDTVQIKAAITSVNDLHEYGCLVTNPATNDTLFNFSEHSHDKSVNLEKKVVIMVTGHSDLLLTVLAEDHDENSAKATRSFHCHH